MKKRLQILSLLLLTLLTFVPSLSLAALELELTQGIESALPIAVMPFETQGEPPATLHDSDAFASIISNDLLNSGRFRSPASGVLAKYNSSSSISKWRGLGVDNVVTGKVKYNGNRVSISFSLIQTHGNKPLLLERNYQIEPRLWRSLAHHVSDQIYQNLTGERGVFSTRIAYVLHQQDSPQSQKFTLEVSDADGVNAKPLLISSQPIMSPAWSPNAKEIAYVSFEHAKAEIYRVDVATGRRNLVTSFDGINGAPTWSPDGKKMAVVLSKSGYAKIYSIDVTSGKLRQLTNGWSIDTEPAWSPTGNDIIFTSNRGGTPQIYKINLNTENVSRITFEGRYNARARYAPDGKSIVLLHREGDMFNIATQDLSTGYLLNLTHSGVDESPSVAPNGKMILYATRFSGSRVLSVVSSDGRIQLRLPSKNGQVQEPAWSPYLS